MKSYAWVVVFSVALGGSGCDGSEDASAVRGGREPAAAGEPAPLCASDALCAPGFACVHASANGFMPAIGHCLPVGTAGAHCRVANDSAMPCDAALVCAGKDSTCLPIAVPGESCVGAACQPPFVCDVENVSFLVCTAPGASGGGCRAQSPVCDAGLGCLAGRCKPLAAGGVCFGPDKSSPCAEGQLCSHFFGDPGEMKGQCLLPSVVGGACGDPALGRPVCVEGAMCVDGVCRTDAIAPGGTCVAAAINVRCGDFSVCVRNTCITAGTEAAPCRRPPSRSCDAGLACRDDVCTLFVPDGQACEAMSGALAGCDLGSSCVETNAGDVCVRDGALKGRCNNQDACVEGLVCSRGKNNVSVCNIPLPLGNVCSLAREPFEPCESGSSCSAQTRVCAPDGSLAATCLSNGVCAEGLWCVPVAGASRCYPAPPSVPAGAACDTNPSPLQRTNRCAEGAQCQSGLCVELGSQGASCRPFGLQPRCDLGLSCAGGVCQPGAPIGSACLPGGDGECAAPASCVALPDGGACQLLRGYDLVPSARSGAVDACDGGTNVVFSTSHDGLSRDDGHQTVKLPFPFSFWGQVHTEVAVGVNGVAGFPPTGSFLNPGLGGAGLLPNFGQPALIAPFWDDLVLGAHPRSRVCTKPIGQPGAQQFVITWSGMGRYGQANTSLTFSVVLHEGTNYIDFFYDDLFAPAGAAAFVSGVRAAIGLQSTGGWSHVIHNGAVSIGRTFRFVPKP